MKQFQEELLRKKNSIIENLQFREKSLARRQEELFRLQQETERLRKFSKKFNN